MIQSLDAEIKALQNSPDSSGIVFRMASISKGKRLERIAGLSVTTKQ